MMLDAALKAKEKGLLFSREQAFFKDLQKYVGCSLKPFSAGPRVQLQKLTVMSGSEEHEVRPTSARLTCCPLTRYLLRLKRHAALR